MGKYGVVENRVQLYGPGADDVQQDMTFNAGKAAYFGTSDFDGRNS